MTDKNILSTVEVTKKVGISVATLERWLAESKVPSPDLIVLGGRSFRNWKKADVVRLKRHKAATYRKGRGRKPSRRGKSRG